MPSKRGMCGACHGSFALEGDYIPDHTHYRMPCHGSGTKPVESLPIFEMAPIKEVIQKIVYECPHCHKAITLPEDA